MKQLFPSEGVVTEHRWFSRADLLVIPLIFAGLILLTVAVQGAARPYSAQSPDLTVSLNPALLPYYGLRTLFRMGIAVLCSLVFTFVYATVAAKSRRAERVLIPILDFLQSLPILGFLTVTTLIFLGVFRNSMLGLEAACIFAIFTSQVWNMTFSFYHSLLTVPKELQETASVFRLSGWQRFWRLEVPYATPNLLWNTMMSVSGGWFFVVAAEVITVVGRNQPQALPGVGSYISLAVEHADVPAMVYAGLTLLVLVLIYDQLFFRPLVAWAEKFKFEQAEAQEVPSSWMLNVLTRARFAQRLANLPSPLLERLSLATSRGSQPGKPMDLTAPQRARRQVGDRVWTGVIGMGFVLLLFILVRFLMGDTLGFTHGQMNQPNANLNTLLDPAVATSFEQAGVSVGADQTVYLSAVCQASAGGTTVSLGLSSALAQPGVSAPTNVAQACRANFAPAGRVSWPEVPQVAGLGFLTALRVLVMVVLATLVWTPIGVWIGLRPRAAQVAQPLAQFAAAFPANLVFPVAVVLLVHFSLNPSIWLSPLIVLGTQWYILFNVIAGTISLPSDLKEAAAVMGVRPWSWLWWKTLILPGIFPAFVTGGITASGGSWNASIVAEVVSWGPTILVATGLGAYIATWSTGEFNAHVALGMLVMGLLVLLINRLLWHRLYRLAEERYRLA